MGKWFRWDAYKVLPRYGGMDDQIEREMRTFDIIGSEVSAWKREKQEEQVARASRQRSRGRGGF